MDRETTSRDFKTPEPDSVTVRVPRKLWTVVGWLLGGAVTGGGLAAYGLPHLEFGGDPAEPPKHTHEAMKLEILGHEEAAHKSIWEAIRAQQEETKKQGDRLERGMEKLEVRTFQILQEVRQR